MKTFILLLLVAFVGIPFAAAEPVVNADVCLKAIVTSSTEEQLVDLMLRLTKICSVRYNNERIFDYVKEALTKAGLGSIVSKVLATIQRLLNPITGNGALDVASNLFTKFDVDGITGVLTGGLNDMINGGLGGYLGGHAQVDAGGLANVAGNGLLNIGGLTGR